MSKPFQLFSRKIYISVFLSLFSLSVTGQVRESEVVIDLGNLPVVKIEAQTGSRRNLSFLKSIAGVDKLSDRISGVQVRQGSASLAIRRLGDGEYVSESDFDSVSYELDLSPMKSQTSSAHVSWFAKDVGILMGADLLPQLTKGPISIRFLNGPSIFAIHSSEMQEEDGRFTTSDPENSVFFVGSGWRAEKTFRYKQSAQCNVSGEWLFADSDSTTMVADLLVQYQKLFRDVEPLPNVQVGIVRFPLPVSHGAWEAETRGGSVIIVSSDMPFKTQSLQRLHEQLRHELFHLWIPNRLNLTGNYDWFYEGFALYESLKLAVALNRIRFEDFLDTLSRAHTIDGAQSQRISLVQASRNRFGGSNTQVYARGMLVAFLADLAIMEQSKGPASIEDVLRELYRTHGRQAAPMDGNDAVIQIMKARPGMSSIVEKYVAGADKIDWTKELAASGIEDMDAGPITTLRVKEKLKGSQKAMLDKLGYNNWRKLSGTSK
ncbi:MAG: hypothetical protein ABI646_02010 [Acidobacteriota bacterium]